MRFGFLFALPALLAACSSSKARVDGGVIDASPGRATFYLIVPGSQSFCDPVASCQSPYRDLRITTAAGELVPLPRDSGCQHFCLPEAQCASVCVTVDCPPQGLAVENGTRTWNGVYETTSACGVDCPGSAYAVPGEYKAQLCATPGTLTTSDAGPPTCTTTGPEVCGPIVPFTFPQAGSIDLPLIAP
jgi:hypothetical protein